MLTVWLISVIFAAVFSGVSIIVHLRHTFKNYIQNFSFIYFSKVSEILKGKEFCVVNGSSSLPKPALEKKIIECGGNIVQNPGQCL